MSLHSFVDGLRRKKEKQTALMLVGLQWLLLTDTITAHTWPCHLSVQFSDLTALTEVLEWAKKKKLTVDTRDVKLILNHRAHTGHFDLICPRPVNLQFMPVYRNLL